MALDMLRASKTRALRINSIVRKEISALLTDKISIFILFFIPVILIIVLGTSFPRAELGETNVWVIDKDNTTVSRNYVAHLKNSSMNIYGTGDVMEVEGNVTHPIIEYEVTEANARLLLPTNFLSAYIIIPEGFSESLLENSTGALIVHYDAIDSIAMLIVKFSLMGQNVQYQLNALILERDVFYFPETRPDMNFDMSGEMDVDINILEVAAPMFVGIVLFACMNLVCTQSIVGDVPLQRLLTTPVYRSEVITGKIISYGIVAIFQILVTMALLIVFGVTFRCLIFDMFLMLLLNSLAGISIGMLISAVSKTRLQAAQSFLLVFFVLMIFMAQVRNPLILPFIPVEQCRSAFGILAFRGGTLGDILPQIMNMVLTIVVFYVATLVYIRKFKKEFV
jgi:ABC-type Na+ efflux pump permease subunit